MFNKKTSQDSDASVALSTVDNGKTVYLDYVDAGEELKNRLASMGILAHTPINIIMNHKHGQIIVSVKGAKMILGRGMSHKIFVRYHNQ